MEKQYTREHICRYIWMLLVNLAKEHKTAYYNDFREEILTEFGVKYANRSIGGLLAPILEHCKICDKPPLTALVINKHTGLPGERFDAEEIFSVEAFDRIKERIFAYNWDNEENPFQGYDAPESSVKSYARRILRNPDTSKEVWRKVKDRGQCQSVFREALLRAYGCKCAVCGFSLKDLLQAAHIQAWSETTGENKISVNNGFLLCPNHHALYDKGWLTVSEDYTIGLGKKGKFTEADEDALVNFVGKRIRLPKDRQLWPSPELLKKHTGKKEKKEKDPI